MIFIGLILIGMDSSKCNKITSLTLKIGRNEIWPYCYLKKTVLSSYWWLFRCKESVTNISNRPPRSQGCHQNKPPPRSVTNIDVVYGDKSFLKVHWIAKNWNSTASDIPEVTSICRFCICKWVIDYDSWNV